jgi:hypothetical protein
MKAFFTYLVVFLITVDAKSQEKNFIDQPYLETFATVDTFVVPDKIFISIVLNEEDSRNKKSTEELELALTAKLKELQIDIEKDLTLLDYSSNFKSYFLKGKNILKIKNYSLLVKNAVIASKVLTELENIGISNVNIENTEYSKTDQLILRLKAKAILRAKENANALIESLGQKTGKAIYISDNNSITNGLQGRAAGIQIRGAASLYGSRAAEPIVVDFQKLKFESQVTVRFIVL